MAFVSGRDPEGGVTSQGPRAKVQSLALVLNLTPALPVLTSRSLSHQLSEKGNSLCPLYSVPLDPYHISEADTAGSV